MKLQNFTGRKVAIDASMAMYQFLIAVRSNGPGGNNPAAQLTNDAGEVTSHIQGMFNRTIKLMSAGIQPVYVFDGKPPQMKGGELAKRLAKRSKAEADLAAAKEAGEQDDVDKFSRRLVKVTRSHNEDCKALLRLMGVPVVDAPCEAEAQCAELAKKSKVYATATEDMDALTFRTPKLIRRLTFSQAAGKDKIPILEIDYQLVISGLGLTYEQFVDLCILCGCDYCSSIKGIGPKTALKLIKQHGNIETLIEALKKEKKYDIPSDWQEQRVPKQSPETEEKEEEEEEEEEKEEEDDERSEDKVVADANAADEDAALTASAAAEDAAVSAAEGNTDAPAAEKASSSPVKVLQPGVELEEGEYDIVPPLYAQARLLFTESDVFKGEDVTLKWEPPQEAELTEFLVVKMGFNPDRVASGIQKLKDASKQKAQQRMDSFFKPVAGSSSVNATAAGSKRKIDVKAAGAKGAKKGSFGKKR